jgi:hypothetical protein
MGSCGPLRIAFLTPLIHSHSNVHFALFRQLLCSASSRPLDIHVIGDEPLRLRLAEIEVVGDNKLTFHAIDSEDCLHGIANLIMVARLPPLSITRKNGFATLNTISHIICPEPAPYLERFKHTLMVVEELQPDALVTDIIYAGIAIDVSKKTGTKLVGLMPAQDIDLRLFEQPWGSGFWKYPM